MKNKYSLITMKKKILLLIVWIITISGATS